MADVIAFDATLKKKKKKPTSAFDAAAAAAAAAPAAAAADAEAAFGALKKKKKRTPKPAAALDSPDSAADAPALSAADFAAAVGARKPTRRPKRVGFGDDLSLEEAAAASASAAAADGDGDDGAASGDEAGDASGDEGADDGLPWRNSARDYTYAELVQRVFGFLTKHHPQLSGDTKRHIIQAPQVQREGKHRTVFSNFSDISQTMKRKSEHLYAFILAELGTSASIDGNNRMVLRGRYQPKNIENVLRRYITEYVQCHSCKSTSTELIKENRLFFLRCSSCGARRSVASIKSGFQAKKKK